MDRLAAIEIFIRVVDTGSFSAAARHYDVGQPAVSKAIAQLEDWLGVKLLLRSTRALTPTEAGNSFYQRAKRAVEEGNEAVLAARGNASGLSGKLRVSAGYILRGCISCRVCRNFWSNTRTSNWNSFWTIVCGPL
jgi:DNA-binding transcriptional LysR family regulator